MLLGPVFQTEMVANARRGRYFVLRVLFAAGLLFALWVCYVGVADSYGRDGRLTIREASTLASTFFVTFVWITILTAMVITPAVSAGAIASERERRTIEYLFATDLSNTEIVLSKLCGKLLLVGKLVMVTLPVLAIFRLLGGIPGNLLVGYFALLASTVTLLTVGAMCISVWTKRARDAVIRVYLVEAVVFVLPLVINMLLMALGGGGGVLQWISDRIGQIVALLLEINPIYLLLFQMAPGGTLGVGVNETAMWRMVVWQLGFSLVLAVVAVLAVRRVHLRSISSSGGKGGSLRFELPRFRPAMHNQPMLWKELFARTASTQLGVLGRIAIALLLIVTMGIALYSYAYILDTPANQWQTQAEMFAPCSIMITGFLGAGMALLMGVRAAGLVTYEKERDCWLSLIATPLTGADIVGAKALGNVYAFRWMLLPLGVTWLLQLTLSPIFLIGIPLHLFAIGVTSVFATAVGLAYSLKFTTSLKAIGATSLTLFFVGGGYFFCCCFPLIIVGNGGEDEIIKVALIGCIPFLQAVPGFVVVDDFLEGDEPWVAFDYVAGVAMYGTAAIVILSSLVARFDEFVGRTSSPVYASPSRTGRPGATPPGTALPDPFTPPNPATTPD